MYKKKSFTVFKLVFVILIIGVLSVVVVSKSATTITDNAHAVATVENIKNIIQEIQSYIIKNGGKSNEYNITDMSHIIKRLYKKGKVRLINSNNFINQIWIYTDKKEPIGQGCVSITVGSNNIRLTFDKNNNNPICLKVKKILKYYKLDENESGKKSIYYKISGTKVKF